MRIVTQTSSFQLSSIQNFHFDDFHQTCRRWTPTMALLRIVLSRSLLNLPQSNLFHCSCPLLFWLATFKLTHEWPTLFRKIHHQLWDMKCCWRHNLQPQIDFSSHWARHYDVTIWTSKSRSYLSNLSSSSTRWELPPFSPTVVFTPPWRTHRPSLEEIVRRNRSWQKCPILPNWSPDSVDSFLPIVAKSLVRGAQATLTAKPA